jgi:DNA-binding NtrC family response regulator
MTRVESILSEGAGNVRLDFPEQQKILSISPNAEDSAALRRIADDTHWRVWSVRTCCEALERLASERFAVVLCESTLEDGSWKDILGQLGTGAGAPPLVVTSRLADANLWAEVLNLGGYDVLAKPFEARDVSHVLKTISLQPARKGVRARTAVSF